MTGDAAGPGLSAAEAEALDRVTGPDAPSADAGRVRRRASAGSGGRTLLLPALRALQERVGRITPAALAALARRLDLPQADVFAVASFYALLEVGNGSPRKVHLCDDIVCRLRGADAIADAWEAAYGRDGAAPGGATLHRSPCLGQCDRAPAALLAIAGEAPVEAVSAPTEAAALAALLAAPAAAASPAPARARAAGGVPVTLARVGRVDPESLDSYRAAGGYTALRNALALGREGVLQQVAESALQGRGGAAFPTAVKWRAVASQADRPHYIVANGDESEPGTFKDRVLMEEDPFAVIEALTVAAFAIDAEKGYVYVRGEYPLAARRLAEAAAQARARGLLGENVLGRGLVFDVEVRRGAGAYICGEETALLNSIEGRQGEPRNKPPYPATNGLFGRPTAVNNIETLVSVLAVLTRGAAAFKALGTAEAPGTRLFCVSGSVVEPGVYEAPTGTTLRALLEMAGGVPLGRRLRAVLLGGAAGAFVGPDALDVALTPSAVQAVGATLGSGVVAVFDDQADLRDVVLRIARFFRDESCGQCVPCRIGTVRQEEMVARLVAGRPLASEADERARFGDLAMAMRDASICGLGQTAASAVESALRLGILTGGGR